MDDSFDVHYLRDGMSADICGMQACFAEMTHPVKSFAISLCAAGRRFVYSGDTPLHDRIPSFAAGADLYLADAGLTQAYAGGPHMTMREACMSGAGCKMTLLTHISPLYGEEELLKEVEGEARFVRIAESYDI